MKRISLSVSGSVLLLAFAFLIPSAAATPIRNVPSRLGNVQTSIKCSERIAAQRLGHKIDAINRKLSNVSVRASCYRCLDDCYTQGCGSVGQCWGECDCDNDGTDDDDGADDEH